MRPHLLLTLRGRHRAGPGLGRRRVPASAGTDGGGEGVNVYLEGITFFRVCVGACGEGLEDGTPFFFGLAFTPLWGG